MLRDQIEVQDNDSGNDEKLKDLQSNYLFNPPNLCFR